MKPNAIMNTATANRSAVINMIPVKALTITNVAAAAIKAYQAAFLHASIRCGGEVRSLNMAKV